MDERIPAIGFHLFIVLTLVKYWLAQLVEGRWNFGGNLKEEFHIYRMSIIDFFVLSYIYDNIQLYCFLDETFRWSNCVLNYNSISIN